MFSRAIGRKKTAFLISRRKGILLFESVEKIGFARVEVAKGYNWANNPN